MNTESSAESGCRSILLPSRRQLFIALAIYFVLHLVIRTFISTSTDLDEAEQIVLTQKLDWGYGPQPPLYTWIQFAFFKLFGTSVFALATVKAMLLFGLFTFSYAATWRTTNSHAAGLVTVCSLMFLPQVSWESQRDLTHSVLAATMSVATWFVFLQLLERPKISAYALFGLCAGLGTLSKYNYALLPAGMTIAALTMKEFRRTILNGRFPFAIATAIVVVLPNAIWIANHDELAFSASTKFQIQENGSWLATAGVGLGRLLLSMISFSATVVIINWLIFGYKKSSAADVRPRAQAQYDLLSRTLLVIIITLVLLVMTFRITNIRERWLLPFLILLPILAGMWAQPRLHVKHARRFVGLASFVALAILIAIPVRVVFGHNFHRDEPLMRPYEQLAQQLGGRLQPGTVIVADRAVLAGNVRLHLANHLAVTPELAELLTPNAMRFALIWDHAKSKTIPGNLEKFYRTKTGVPFGENRVELIPAHYRYQPSRLRHLAFVRVPTN